MQATFWGGEIDSLSIERLRQFEPPEGYYLAFSGGKDSIVLYHLAYRAKVRFNAVYNYTTVDPPELVSFIKLNYPEVEISRPSMTMFQLIVKHGMPPTRKVRYCCEELKERGGMGRVVLTGIRAKESNSRRKRGMVESCYKHPGKTYLHPIIDWTETDVWQYIRERKIKYCSLYDEGYKRLGCIMCPYHKRGMLKDAIRWPNFYKAYIQTFQKMVDKRKKDGLPTTWKTGLEVMKWWVSGKGKEASAPMFFDSE